MANSLNCSDKSVEICTSIITAGSGGIANYTSILLSGTYLVLVAFVAAIIIRGLYNSWGAEKINFYDLMLAGIKTLGLVAILWSLVV